MNLKTRSDGALASVEGQAQPLPLPHEGEGRAAPLPTPRADDGCATPLPVAPRVDDTPDEDDPPSAKSRETYSITKPALDYYYYERAKGHFARFNNMSVAFKLAGRDLKTRIVKNGRVFDLKPPTAFESFLESQARRTRDGAAQEAPDVAARRRDWDEAKRSGDAGAMTTTANALMRAVEEAREHLGAHEAAHPTQRGVRHPTIGETLNPTAQANDGNEIMQDVQGRALAEGRVTKWLDANGALPYLTPDGDIARRADSREPQSDANMPSGEVARAPEPESDAEMPPSQTARTRENDEAAPMTLTPKQVDVVVKAIKTTAVDQRADMLRRLQREVGGEVVEQALHKVELAERLADGATFALAGAEAQAAPMAAPASTGQPPALRGRQPDDEEGYDEAPYILPWREQIEVWPPAAPPNTEPRVGGPSEKFQPGAWRQDYMPLTAAGSVLVDKEDLPPRIRRNLEQREWRSPTGRPPGNRQKLSLGWGYFGGPRGNDPNAQTYHGALDFPGDNVVMPTRARLANITYSKRAGWTLTFDLGDGIMMSLHHMVPTDEVRRRFTAGDVDFDIGQHIGSVDPLAYGLANDHVHLQIKLGPGRYRGQRVKAFAINPTSLFP